jgi:hypothetical protein
MQAVLVAVPAAILALALMAGPREAMATSESAATSAVDAASDPDAAAEPFDEETQPANRRARRAARLAARCRARDLQDLSPRHLRRVLRRCGPTIGGSSGVARGDFNCDGFADLAVGVPFEDVGNVANAGAVNVIYGSAGGLRAVGSQFLHEDTPAILGSGAEAGDQYGHALAAGNFNGDSCSDLAIGIPGEDSGAPGLTAIKADVGAVQVLYGSSSGLTSNGSQLLFQGPIQGPAGPVVVPGDAEAGDRFGHSLTWGDFNGDAFGDLAVGVPFEDVGSIQDAGAVNTFLGSPFGLLPIGDFNRGMQFLTQATTFRTGLDPREVVGTGDSPEPFDFFGLHLAAGNFNGEIRPGGAGIDDLVVGVPREDLGTIEDAGVVHVFYGSHDLLAPLGFTSPAFPYPSPQLWHQNRPFVNDGAERSDRFGSALAAGNFNGDAFADLAIGVPLEDTDVQDAGAVSVIYGSAGGVSATAVRPDQLVTQDGFLSGGGDIHNDEEVGDRFGWSLAAANFDADGYDDLAVGVPFENLRDFNSLCGRSVDNDDAGAVNVLYGSASGAAGAGLGTDRNQFLFQGGFGALAFPKFQRPGHLFGLSISAWNFDGAAGADLAIGVPGDGLATFGRKPFCPSDFVTSQEGSPTREGAVEVLYSVSGGPAFNLASPRNQKWSQNDIAGDGAEREDQFGRALY